ncbi:hypothetical protein I302_106334 [Kwoniella bestiolae CBS 10118]|uniref:Uncharacterized protein n=1 Tax=Kwoniella bestiolae CBS 10118 TaxID=1296100 RepID=A0A1B9G3N1_9TREE|nr:hypothetical protein I302_05458 [Kwoniella bestiolae CBS 10118]OCF25634.1 hypothetical protein I302_05458 [Kwoniella bestiolae CBS 10118]
MTYRRLLTSLASHPPSSLSSNSRLIPPYAQHLPSLAQTPSSSLRPPYEHTAQVANVKVVNRSLKSPMKFELLLSNPQNGSGASKLDQWKNEVLSNDQSRAGLEKRWREVVGGLERLRDGQNEVPQIAFQRLSSELSSASTVNKIKDTGLVVVRDVVRDSEAIEWAREVLLSVGERGGRAVYWHPSLLSARSNPSILSANSQVSSALLSSPEVYLKASTIIEGLHPQPIIPPTTSSDLWSTPGSLLSHLTLTPSIPNSSTIVSPTILAAEYAALRPFFRSIKSKISFYSSSSAEYLDLQNWELLDPSSPVGEMDLPHLKSIQIIHPELTPGDMVFYHSALPITTSPNSGQVFLPLQPILKGSEGSAQWVEEQKKAFEKGVPPPGEAVGDNEGLWLLEEKGERGMIGSRAGRDAMGY